MHRSHFAKAVKPLDAVEKIKMNDGQSFIWSPVVGKNDCLFEIGGTNHKGHLVLKAYIPNYDEKSGEALFYPNDFMSTNFAITTGSGLHKNDGVIVDYEKFISIIKKDVRCIRRSVKYRQVVEEVEEVTFVKKC
jgi:hypothetical protein